MFKFTLLMFSVSDCMQSVQCRKIRIGMLWKESVVAWFEESCRNLPRRTKGSHNIR